MMSLRSRFPRLFLPATIMACALAAALPTRAATVFSTDFESGIPAQLTGQGVRIEGVQGLAGLGAAGNQFGGSLLRYYTQTLYDTSLTLTNLPAHTHVSLGFLLGLIDSWDGTELFQVEVDGQLLFSHWFQLATGDASSYVAPTGGLLSSGTQLGWSIGSYYNHDRALDLSLEPVFNGIPHTASTLTLTLKMGAVSGGAASNWQGGTDESWVIDNLVVAVSGGTSATPLPTAGLSLLPNVPNPFNPSTAIRFDLASGGSVDLRVFDARGRLVRRLAADAVYVQGRHDVVWDGRDERGQAVASGVYVVELTAGAARQSQQVMLLK